LLTNNKQENAMYSTINLRSRVALVSAAAGLLLMAGCAANPMTPTPPPAPVVSAPPPKFDMGTPDATFVYLPEVGIADMGSATGSSGGTGTLSYKHKKYTFTAAGVSATRMGENPGPIAGEVYGLKALRDINGTYTAEMMAGGKEAVLKNQSGVTIHVVAASGVQMSPTTVVVRLNYR
jgi:hypothetical protein